VAVARVFRRSPSVTQIVVSNRFRPGFADLVSQVSQHGICVVDTAAATFDEVVARAQSAATSTSFYSYYDPVECARLLDEAAAQVGHPDDISWCLNDRRGIAGPDDGDGDVPTESELTRVLPHTTLYWDRKWPTSDGPFFMHADSAPMRADRDPAAEGLPAVYLEVWTDTHHFALAQIEAFVREMEAVVVAAAFDAEAVAARG
jgi:hypothetical protein